MFFSSLCYSLWICLSTRSTHPQIYAYKLVGRHAWNTCKHKPSQVTHFFLLAVSTRPGSAAAFWRRCPPSRRCGFQRQSSKKREWPSCTKRACNLFESAWMLRKWSRNLAPLPILTRISIFRKILSTCMDVGDSYLVMHDTSQLKKRRKWSHHQIIFSPRLTWRFVSMHVDWACSGTVFLKLPEDIHPLIFCLSKEIKGLRPSAS